MKREGGRWMKLPKSGVNLPRFTCLNRIAEKFDGNGVAARMLCMIVLTN